MGMKLREEKIKKKKEQVVGLGSFKLSPASVTHSSGAVHVTKWWCFPAPHMCDAQCVKESEEELDKLIGRPPLLFPLLCGWERWVQAAVFPGPSSVGKRDSLFWQSAGLIIKRLWGWILAGAAGEFSSPELNFCADSRCPFHPVLLQWHKKDPGHFAKSAGGRFHLNTHAPLT